MSPFVSLELQEIQKGCLRPIWRHFFQFHIMWTMANYYSYALPRPTGPVSFGFPKLVGKFIVPPAPRIPLNEVSDTGSSRRTCYADSLPVSSGSECLSDPPIWKIFILMWEGRRILPPYPLFNVQRLSPRDKEIEDILLSLTDLEKSIWLLVLGRGEG